MFRFVSPLSHGHLHFLLLIFIFGSSGLDEGPGKGANPLNGPLGCSTGMSSSKFQPWGLLVPGSVILDSPAGSAAVSLRDKTRDAFARMEKMDTVKQLAGAEVIWTSCGKAAHCTSRLFHANEQTKTRTTVRP